MMNSRNARRNNRSRRPATRDLRQVEVCSVWADRGYFFGQCVSTGLPVYFNVARAATMKVSSERGTWFRLLSDSMLKASLPKLGDLLTAEVVASKREKGSLYARFWVAKKLSSGTSHSDERTTRNKSARAARVAARHQAKLKHDARVKAENQARRASGNKGAPKGDRKAAKSRSGSKGKVKDNNSKAIAPSRQAKKEARMQAGM